MCPCVSCIQDLILENKNRWKKKQNWPRGLSMWKHSNNMPWDLKYTLAICFTFIMYLASSVFGLIILVHLATWLRNEVTIPKTESASYWLNLLDWTHTWRGCSSCIICLSETRSHWLGAAKPVSDSLIPIFKKIEAKYNGSIASK